MFTKACIALGNSNNRSLCSVVCYDIRYHIVGFGTVTLNSAYLLTFL